MCFSSFLTIHSQYKVLRNVAKDLTWLSNAQRIQPSRQLPPGASTVCLIITRVLREVTKPQNTLRVTMKNPILSPNIYSQVFEIINLVLVFILQAYQP